MRTPVLREPRRILVAGDIHSDDEWLRELVAQAAAADCQAIVQLGDLGFWPRLSRGQGFIDAARTALSDAGLDLCFIEGNHDDINLLFDDATTEIGPFRRFAEHIYYVTRGARWSWGGLRFLGVGGGYSLDRELRIEGFTWFPREVISEDELAEILAGGGGIDVLLSHDCPASIAERFGIPPHEPSQAHRRALETIVEQLRIPLVLHGHLHRGHISLHRSGGSGLFSLIIGFADQREPHDNFLIFDLAELKAQLLRVPADERTGASGGS